jgi:hypothetical protein
MLHALLATIGALAVLASVAANCLALAAAPRADARASEAAHRPLTPRRTAASARSSCPVRLRR